MTEVYEKWRTDPAIFDILDRLCLDALGPNLQQLLERAVNSPVDSNLSRTKLGKALGQKCIPLPPIRLLANAVAGKNWSTVGHGTDPVFDLDGLTRNGPSHPQSLQDDTA